VTPIGLTNLSQIVMAKPIATAHAVIAEPIATALLVDSSADEPTTLWIDTGDDMAASPRMRPRLFLAMLPLVDQSAAKDRHILMMPVQISYPTMAALLNRPPITSTVLSEAEETELFDTMTALVRSGRLCVSHTRHGPVVGFQPGCKPPAPGAEISPLLSSLDTEEVRAFQSAAEKALRKQLVEGELRPQLAISDDQQLPDEMVAAQGTCGQEQTLTGSLPPSRTKGRRVRSQPAVGVAARTRRMRQRQPALAPPCTPPCWQSNLVGWSIEAEHYLTGASVQGRVSSWESEAQTFTLTFENGSVESAQLPQPAVRPIDPCYGAALTWDQYFDMCRLNGLLHHDVDASEEGFGASAGVITPHSGDDQDGHAYDADYAEPMEADMQFFAFIEDEA